MAHSIVLVALVVPDYDEAIAYFTEVLRFALVEDEPREAGKRWVVVAPRGRRGTEGADGAHGAGLLLAKAANAEQLAHVGNQTGGRVFLFLHTADFEDDYQHLRSHGVRFAAEPREEPYGRVVVFFDRYGNKWDLIQPNEAG
jgi:catechol 2,3-dioxygenase-like lactoylglutathione lyase family enzyme